MALALADSLITVGWDIEDQAQRYLAWWREGKYSVNDSCFDIGITTATSLQRFERGMPASRSGIASSDGNGVIMRLAPVVMAYGTAPPLALAERCRESALPTHGSWVCQCAAEVFGRLLQQLLQGADKAEALSFRWWEDIASLPGELQDIMHGSFRKPRREIRSTGYVVHSLEASLWAFDQSDSFSAAVTAAVNLGNDADTIGAITGQLAGAYWGYNSIPDPWLSELIQRERIEKAAQTLIQRYR
jgi:ADP-ribosyl-[dinitrogen reductase] hydrolase